MPTAELVRVRCSCGCGAAPGLKDAFAASDMLTTDLVRVRRSRPAKGVSAAK